MKNLKLILIIAVLLIKLNTYGQQKYNSYKDYVLNTATFIFEGTVIERIPFFDKNTNSVHSSNKVLINKVLRNTNESIKVGTIQVIEDNYSGTFIKDDGEMIITKDNDWMPIPNNGIYFCVKYDSSPYKINTDNSTSLKPLTGIDLTIRDYFENINSTKPTFHGLKAFEKNYSSKDNFYKDISQYPNIVIPDNVIENTMSNEMVIKQNLMQQTAIEDTIGNSGRYKEHLDNYQSYMDKVNKKLAQNSTKEKNITSEDITFSIANTTQTGTGPYYLEFDVLANGNDNSTYFDNCLLRIAYNPISFGSNIVANNNVTITKGASYNSVTYIDPNTNSIDQTSSVMGVPFGTDFTQSTLYRTQLTTIPTQLLHFKMKILVCYTNPLIQFTDTALTSMFSFYAINPDDSITNTISYDNTSYIGSISTSLCAITITSFTTPVYPGAYYPGNPVNKAKLVIQGTNFGSTQGNGNVYFHNADNGGTTYIGLNHYDIINWSDNEIDITVPQFIDSIAGLPSPGSGIFYVKTNSGDSALSSSPIIFPYSITNIAYPTPYQKIRTDLAARNDIGGYTFHLDTSITNYPDPILVPLLKKAVADWVCATGINFYIGTDTALNGYSNDGVSTIFFQTLPFAGNALMDTKDYFVQCTDPTGTQKYLVASSFKIGILRDPSLYGLGYWFFDTLQNAIPATRVDFFQSILHELGHGDLLEHVIQQELMYFMSQYGPLPGALRWLISSDDQNGGINVVDKSASNIYNASCSGTLIIVTSNCVGWNGITELNPNVLGFNAFPNPINNNLLNITYSLKKDAPVKFIVLDGTGREVYKLSENSSSGKHTDQISLENLAAGVYFLEVFINDIGDTQKIIKIR